MRIIRADTMGFCFGVRDAVLALDRVASPDTVTIRGELVHNPEVLRRLEERGFRRQLASDRDLPDTPVVAITAHGAADREIERLKLAGKTVLDTTCPLVRRVHEAARELAAEARLIVVIGRPGHAEVTGIVGNLDNALVIESEADVGPLEAARVGVVCQSTTPPRLAESIVRRLREVNPDSDIRVIDTICDPTRRRQQAVEELARRADLVIVVGGRNSNNSRELKSLAAALGRPVHLVENDSELRIEWFRGVGIVGLTAGTSTPDTSIDAVESGIRRLIDG